MKTMTLEEWRKVATERFGEDFKKWLFVCPNCKTVQGFDDFRATKLETENIPDYLGFSCIGRFVKGKGCDWTLGGLLRIHTLEVIGIDKRNHPRFEFAEKPTAVEAERK